jgi:ATP-binding cassette subfamily E protein 1
MEDGDNEQVLTVRCTMEHGKLFKTLCICGSHDFDLSVGCLLLRECIISFH